MGIEVNRWEIVSLSNREDVSSLFLKVNLLYPLRLNFCSVSVCTKKVCFYKLSPRFSNQFSRELNMGNANCKKKSERKKQIMISKSKLFLEQLKVKETPPVFIDQPNLINSHMKQNFREQFAKEATPICMLITVEEFDNLMQAESLDVRLLC